MRSSRLTAAHLASRFLPAAAAALLLGPTTSATVLLNDTWADGSRTETNLPTESAVYASAPGSVAMAAGSLTYTMSSSSQRLHTYFAPDGSPATIDVGQQLVATIGFSTGTLDNSTGRNFRVGLFSTPAAHVTVDSANDSGGTGSPWASAQGYAAFFPLTSAPGTTQLFQVGKRTAVATGNLMGSTGNYVQDSAGGGIVSAASSTAYSLVITLDRVAANQMNVTFALLDDQGNTLGTHTSIDNSTNFGDKDDLTNIYTSFDMLAFRFSSTQGVSDALTFTNFHVELIPEPGSMALLGLGGLLIFARRKR